MKLTRIITEGVSVSGDELLAYAIVVAEEYDALPAIKASDVKHWASMAAHVDKMMPRIMSEVDIVFTTEDPYPNMREMFFDIIKNKRMKVFATSTEGGQVGSHPALTPEQNDALRAVHDFLAHFGPNSKWFREFMKTNHIDDVNDPKFTAVRFDRNGFTVRGEMNTYLTHSRVAPAEAAPALFTEVVGQICYYFTTGSYTDNKAAVIHGVDFKNVGHFTSKELQQRKEHYMMLLANDDVDSFKTRIPGARIDKSRIRWNLLSRGEGQVRA